MDKVQNEQRICQIFSHGCDIYLTTWLLAAIGFYLCWILKFGTSSAFIFKRNRADYLQNIRQLFRECSSFKNFTFSLDFINCIWPYAYEERVNLRWFSENPFCVCCSFTILVRIHKHIARSNVAYMLCIFISFVQFAFHHIITVSAINLSQELDLPRDITPVLTQLRICKVLARHRHSDRVYLQEVTETVLDWLPASLSWRCWRLQSLQSPCWQATCTASLKPIWTGGKPSFKRSYQWGLAQTSWVTARLLETFSFFFWPLKWQFKMLWSG